MQNSCFLRRKTVNAVKLSATVPNSELSEFQGFVEQK